MPKLYYIRCENLKTKEICDSGFAPCSHEEACILMGKMTNYKWRRIFLVPA